MYLPTVLLSLSLDLSDNIPIPEYAREVAFFTTYLFVFLPKCDFGIFINLFPLSLFLSLGTGKTMLAKAVATEVSMR